MKIQNSTIYRTIIAALIAGTPLSSSIADEDINKLKTELETLKQKVDKLTTQQKSENNVDSVLHVAGYAAIGYADQKNDNGAFNTVRFNPIFHYQYKDLVLLETELEIEIEENGETHTALEYATIDILANDYVSIFGGKFLSPLGQFRQNLHPAWINKLPSAPPGFGHDGAAPEAEVGLGLRGATYAGNVKVNYTAYVGNGPELEEDDDEVHGISSGGFGRDADDNKVFGGRLGILPLPKLELGISAASGKAIITTRENGMAVPTTEPSRDYDVVGVDAAYQFGQFDLRAEYIQQEIGDTTGGLADEGGKWKTWYAQASYKFIPSNFEGVIRYGDYDSPHASQDQQQTAIGVNYLFSANAIAKIAYEINDGQAGSANDENRILLQLTYGF